MNIGQIVTLICVGLSLVILIGVLIYTNYQIRECNRTIDQINENTRRINEIRKSIIGNNKDEA